MQYDTESLGRLEFDESQSNILLLDSRHPDIPAFGESRYHLKGTFTVKAACNLDYSNL